MRRSLVVLALALAGAVLIPQAAEPAAEGQCVLPDRSPLWLDYADGTASWAPELFGKPGLIVASGGAIIMPKLQELGAQTVYWEMKLGQRVGTTTTPAPTDTIVSTADALFELAAA